MSSSSRVYKKSENYDFNCVCGKNFSSKKNFNAHRKRVHGDSVMSAKNTNKKNCVMCSFESDDKNKMVRHFELIHNISITQEKLRFATKDEFMSWKDKVEHETLSNYIKKRGSTQFKDYITSTYICNRSGYYNPTAKGLRHCKVQGSCKINGFCPANITMKLQKNDGSCSVSYTATHVGHKSELKHLTLTSTERENIATKISMKIPFTDILNDIRDSIYDSTIQRIHLLTRQDLYNIEAAFNLTSKAVRHKDDATSVDAWVKEMQGEGNCVLYYKPQGVYNEEISQFKTDDFILIIMTAAQLDILKTYGGDCICIDGTHGLNSYNFELNTILVLDELREGFPCAFLISNRSDTQVLKFFFSQIKLKAGIIRPKVFMSDLAETFFNAWISEMGTPEKRLYCTWHIDKSWRKNLSKIKNKEYQAIIYNHLRTLLTERDENAFKRMLSEFCNITDPDSLEFIKYFKQYYVKNCENWAYCYRLHAGINTNMHLETMHRSIKYIYLKGKNVKRLDKGIAAILTFVRDKLINKVIAINKGKLCGKITNIRSRHLNMTKMNVNNIIVTDNGWQVLSENGFEMYMVQKRDTDCQNCQLRCTNCAICLHQFQCSCLDSSIKYNMCKHIHLVAMSIKSKDNEESLPQPDAIDSLVIEDEENRSEKIIQELSKKKSDESFQKRKETLIKEYVDTINNISIPEQLDYMERNFATLKPTLASIKETSNNNRANLLKPNLNTNTKKHCPSKKFFSTKKKTKKNVRMSQSSQNLDINAVQLSSVLIPAEDCL